MSGVTECFRIHAQLTNLEVLGCLTLVFHRIVGWEGGRKGGRQDSGGEFTTSCCEQASNRRARAGMRMLREDQQAFYRLAVQATS